MKLFSLLFINALVLLLAGCGGGKQEQAAPPPPTITTYTVSQQQTTFSTFYPGKVVALNQVDIHPEVAGYITGIFFKDGQRVHKGQLLYEIDKRKYQAAYDQAMASLQNAQATVQKNQQDVDRYTRLNQQEAIAKQKLDYAVSDLASAKAQVESAKAAISSAATDLHYATITAPFDGTIGISQVKLGAVVSTGSTTLNTISSDDPIAVDFELDEKQLPVFQSLLDRHGKLDSLFTLYLPNQDAYPQHGHFVFIDRAVDPLTGSITVRLSFPNKQGKLKAGLSANVKIYNPEGSGMQLVIPMSATVEQMGEYFVFVVQGDKVKQTRVTLGNRSANTVVVANGLKAGDVIATSGLQRLQDGSPVKTTNGAPPAANTPATK